MKTFLIAAAALSLFASPLLAQTRQDKSATPEAATQRAGQAPAVKGPNDVYSSCGEFLGSDPDPRVRAQILREGNRKCEN
jgi:hypothetical protein